MITEEKPIITKLKAGVNKEGNPVWIKEEEYEKVMNKIKSTLNK